MDSWLTSDSDSEPNNNYALVHINFCLYHRLHVISRIIICTDIVYCVARAGSELFQSRATFAARVAFAQDSNCLPARATHTIFFTPLRS